MADENTLLTTPLETIEEDGDKCTGAVIFLHGSGDTGKGVRTWLKSLHKFAFPHLRVIFPTAPLRPYTPNGGKPSNVWFDRKKITRYAPEDAETVNATAQELVNIVKREVQRGIPLNRIVIGGFSMGGAMACHLGYRYLRGIAGVFALSSFLSSTSLVYESLEQEKPTVLPPLFMCHGTLDDLIAEPWATETYSCLLKVGVSGEYHLLPRVAHELDRKELNMLASWLLQRVPVEED